MAEHSVQVWTRTAGGHRVYTRHHRLTYNPFLPLAMYGCTHIYRHWPNNSVPVHKRSLVPVCARLCPRQVTPLSSILLSPGETRTWRVGMACISSAVWVVRLGPQVERLRQGHLPSCLSFLIFKLGRITGPVSESGRGH